MERPDLPKKPVRVCVNNVSERFVLYNRGRVAFIEKSAAKESPSTTSIIRENTNGFHHLTILVIIRDCLVYNINRWGLFFFY